MTERGEEELLDHLKRVEIGLEAQKKGSAWPVRLSDLTAIIAVIGMVVAIGQAWAVTGQRLDQIEKRQADAQVIVAKVPQLEWTVNQIQVSLQRLAEQGTEQAKQWQEIHDTLLKLGLNVKVK